MKVQASYRGATDSDLPRLKSFLKENGLPELGVDRCISDFVIAEDQDGSWIGAAGLETYALSGLLRSVAVDKRYRGQGFGQGLVQSVIENARARGIRALYLMTDDAAPYFERFGFDVVDRSRIDEAVKASVEFKEICKTATAMHRAIGEHE